MTILLDTHVLVWALSRQDRIPADIRMLIEGAEPFFSVVNIWEIAIKTGLGRAAFQIDPSIVRSALLENGYRELAITGAHALAIGDLPPIHRDPFDRMLVAQATVEGFELLTSDATVARYPGPIRYFG
jgi:PIN domain nuclease of toxin-antitoxin system